MGTPPPPPPPDVPGLEETDGATGGRLLTTRERLELHRASPACSSCHRFMDPIGLALDNFDVTARWRRRENGIPLDTQGTFYDGTPVSTPGELAGALLARPLPLVRTFTENLLALRHRPAGRAPRSADRAGHRAAGRGPRLSPGVLPHGRRAERRVSDEATGCVTAGTSEESHMSYLTGRHLPRRTFPPWSRGDGRAAVSRRDDAGRSAGRRGAGGGRRDRLVCIEEVHGLPGCNEWGAGRHLFAPEAVGKDFAIAEESALPRSPTTRTT